MAQSRFVEAVALHLATRLHQTGTTYRCTCGQYRHQIRVSARRSGIPEERLLAALPPIKPPEPEPKRRRRGRGMSVQVAGAMRVTRGRRRYEGPEAILEVVRE